MPLGWREVVEKRKKVVRAEQERRERLGNESDQNTKRGFLENVLCYKTRS